MKDSLEKAWHLVMLRITAQNHVEGILQLKLWN